MTFDATRKPTTVARPLKVLVPLIKEDLADAEAAGLEHYRRAGELLLEAKEQVPYGAWTRWLSTHFALSRKTAYRYMALAESCVVHGTTQHDAIGERQSVAARRRAGWRRQADDVGALAVQLIDLGYKLLAKRLHPDTGGSTEDMMRLTHVRNVLRRSVAPR
jgi:hypothetical protein